LTAGEGRAILAANGGRAVDYQSSRVNRRQFVQSAGVAGLGLLTGCGLPVSAPPQAAKVYRIAYLSGAGRSNSGNEQLSAFRQGMRDLGYVEGQNLLIEERFAEGDDQLAEPAAELVRLQPEVILVTGVTPVRVVLAVTTTIPIVSTGAGVPDLVASGLAASYARPGGTVTGLSTPSLEGKQLQLLQEAVPTLARVAILFDRATGRAQRPGQEPFEAAARTLGLQLQFVGASGPEDLEPGVETAIREHADGLFVTTGVLLSSNQTRIAELAIQSRLPSMWAQSEAVGRGALMAYGPNRVDLHRRAAYYVDRILKGTSPADLPIEQSREFDFIINLQTAQALGLTIPRSVLLQATEVIQ
jgi:putative tryptophan/tyrosine transport system substrate-binding protein